jgi:hypothetical protein
MPEPERARERERERERRGESPERERGREKTRRNWVPPGVRVNRTKWASGDEGRKEGRTVVRYLGTHQPTNSNPFDGDIAANLGATIGLGPPANSLI